MGLLKNEQGQALTEYVLIIGLVALVAIIGLATIAPALNPKFGLVSNELAK